MGGALNGGHKGSDLAPDRGGEGCAESKEGGCSRSAQFGMLASNS